MSQSEIQFPVHTIENNPESETHLTENKIHFSDQCMKLYKHLMAGNKINGDLARELFGIRHTPRRIKDLREAGIKISDYWENKMKTLFMSNSDIQHNKNIFHI